MKAMKEIRDCHRDCKSYEEHRIDTGDSLDKVFSGFCGEVDYESDNWKYHTVDGHIKKRNICYKCAPEDSEDVPVPSWCPYIAKFYESIIEQLDCRRDERDGDCNSDPARKIVKRTSLRELASQILQELEKHRFSTFAYHARFCPAERDLCLVAIISELRRFSHWQYPMGAFFNLDAEDMKIIKDVTKATGLAQVFHHGWETVIEDVATDIIEKFKQKENEAKASGSGLLPMLETELAVPLVIFMADIILDIPSESEGLTIELKFADYGKDSKGNPYPTEAVKLYYHWPEDSTLTTGELLNSDSEAVLFRILKEIFGIKELTFHINDKIIIGTSLDT